MEAHSSTDPQLNGQKIETEEPDIDDDKKVNYGAEFHDNESFHEVGVFMMVMTLSQIDLVTQTFQCTLELNFDWQASRKDLQN